MKRKCTTIARAGISDLKKKSVLFGCFIVSFLAAYTAFAGVRSGSIFLNFEPEKSSFWHTATNNVMELPVVYPEGASSAELTVTGIGFHRMYKEIAADSVEVVLPPAVSSSTENVYEFSMAFDNGVTNTVRLGLIQDIGEDGCGSTRCRISDTGRKWGAVDRTAVIPVPYGMRDFMLNGVKTDTGLGGAQGWFAVGPLSANEELVAGLVTAEGNVWQALMIGKFSGFYLHLR